MNNAGRLFEPTVFQASIDAINADRKGVTATRRLYAALAAQHVEMTMAEDKTLRVKVTRLPRGMVPKRRPLPKGIKPSLVTYAASGHGRLMPDGRYTLEASHWAYILCRLMENGNQLAIQRVLNDELAVLSLREIGSSDLVDEAEKRLQNEVIC